MPNFDMWAWYGQGLLPQVGPNDLRAGYNNQLWTAGSSFEYAPYGSMQMVDADGNGILRDSDTGDGTAAGGDGLILPDNSFVHINEVAIYNNTVLTYLDFDGVQRTWTVALTVWQTDGGDAVLRLNNALNATWPSDFFPGNLQSIQVGTWNGIEYGGSTVASHVDQPVVPCFTAGTLIRTDRGDVAVESLKVGDLVATLDNGFQPIRWIGRRDVGRAMIATFPQYRPIRIAAGALGPGIPGADLVVSPQHRVLVRSAVARRIFESPEVLVAAKQLTAMAGIEVAEDLAEVSYFHLLFDAHQVILANGAETESLYTGSELFRALDTDALAEALALFPELRDGPSVAAAARRLVPGRKGRALARRHAKNGQPMQHREAAPI